MEEHDLVDTTQKSKLLSHNTSFSHFKTPNQSFSGKQKLQLGIKTVICSLESKHHTGAHACVCQFLQYIAMIQPAQGSLTFPPWPSARELDSEKSHLLLFEELCCKENGQGLHVNSSHKP